ncbi:hypothetical protein SHJG_p1098 (plasmid) [Streptomyces hygroscopicus subsp. jinggangensis 5008]|nr:hypothetical protein SHJG_p1098 [Streptomyces hygroscopicus subsp. jinggangensis 5008]AGF68383.1 hypothetical protein SHJGH_p1098 [Streptomyces hygroscopicus subsp. jinggangensis TL01]
MHDLTVEPAAVVDALRIAAASVRSCGAGRSTRPCQLEPASRSEKNRQPAGGFRARRV